MNRPEISDSKQQPSDVLGVLREQASKSNQMDMEWDRRVSEVAAILEQEHKKIQEGIAAARVNK
jgi:hypothetical protein